MKIEGKVSIDKGQAILRKGAKRVVLLPYPVGTELPQVQMESIGVALFAYLNERQVRLRGDLEGGVLYNARIADPVRKVLDVPLVSEKKKDPLQLEMQQYFKRDADEISRSLNFAGIRSIAAFYHRLKGNADGPKAMAAYLRVPKDSLLQFAADIERESEKDSRKRRLIAAPVRFPVARGVNTARLKMEQGVPATRSATARPLAFPTSEATPDLPSKVDHRKHMTPVRGQGQRGTCVAHTAAAMMEHALIRAQKGKRNLDLSEQYLYWACKTIDGYPDDEGTFIQYAVDVLRDGILAEQLSGGACRERFWVYAPAVIEKNESHAPLPKRVRNAPRFSANIVKKVNQTSISDLKNALADGHCVGLSVYTYDFWDDPYAWSEGVISLPFGIKSNGAHAVCLVGYEDEDDTHGDGYFIFKNSWTNAWGASHPTPGYGNLPYRYVLTEAIEAWLVQL
jgi:C1A family cysteine protease